MKVSCVILTHNSQDALPRALRSVKWCGEVVVIDDTSIDKTVEIARKLGAVVYKRGLQNDFSAQRNYGLEKADNDWVLFLDSDEEISPKLAREIQSIEVEEKVSGYYLVRRDIWLGRRLAGGENGKIELLRLGRKKSGSWERRVHEKWKINGKIGELQGELLHYPHESVKEFINHVNFHASLHAEESRREGKSVDLGKVIFFPIAKFFVNFFIKRGYKDGTHGFVAAIIMSFHSFLAWGEYYMKTRE